MKTENLTALTQNPGLEAALIMCSLALFFTKFYCP